MVKHGALSKSHVYKLLRSKDARVRRAAFTLLETSNPRLRRRSELFIGVTRFSWDANPSYEVYQEFTKRHFQARYKVHQLIDARLKIEKQEKQSAAVDDLAGNTPQYEGGFFKRLFRRRSGCSQRKPKSSLPLGMTTEVIEWTSYTALRMDNDFQNHSLYSRRDPDFPLRTLNIFPTNDANQ